MNLAGFQATTLIDFPGRVAATLFAAGCNFRCPFCHNAELVIPERVRELSPVDSERVLEELERRRGFLDGVVLTGGEPTLQEDLGDFIARLRGLGFLVKLDTNGSRPEVVRSLVDDELVDYVAVDVKAPPNRYAEFAGVEVPADAIERTVTILRESRVEYEFRTTVAPGLAEDDLEAIAAWLRPARRYVLQAFRVPGEPGKALLDPSWATREGLKPRELRRAWAKIESGFESGGVRA